MIIRGRRFYSAGSDNSGKRKEAGSLHLLPGLHPDEPNIISFHLASADTSVQEELTIRFPILLASLHLSPTSCLVRLETPIRVSSTIHSILEESRAALLYAVPSPWVSVSPGQVDLLMQRLTVASGCTLADNL